MQGALIICLLDLPTFPKSIQYGTIYENVILKDSSLIEQIQ